MDEYTMCGLILLGYVGICFLLYGIYLSVTKAIKRHKAKYHKRILRKAKSVAEYAEFTALATAYEGKHYEHK